MNKGDINQLITYLNGCLKPIKLSNDKLEDEVTIKSLEAKIKAVLPNAKVDYEIQGDSALIRLYLDDYYYGRLVSKDISKVRPKFSYIEKLHRGIEILIDIYGVVKIISVNLCVDYKLQNGYSEKGDIVTIVEKEVNLKRGRPHKKVG